MGLLPIGFWAASGAGGGVSGPAFELISTTVLGSTTASVTFDTSTYAALGYRHLQIRAVARGTRASTVDAFIYQYNNDTGSNYSGHYLIGASGSISTGYDPVFSYGYLGLMPAATDTANLFGAFIIDLPEFSQTTKTKVMKNLNGTNGSSSPTNIALRSAMWNSTAAITSIKFYAESGSLATGTRISIYGIRG